MSKQKDRQRYRSVCCKCGNVFYACKSMAQEIGVADAGHGSCPKCNTFLNLTFDEETKEMKTVEWEKYVTGVKKKQEIHDVKECKTPCNKCERCFLDSSTNLYCCGFWSSDDELVAIDSVPDESFENEICKFIVNE